MGIVKWMWEQAKKEEQMAIQAAMTANMMAEEHKKMHTCKMCKRIFSEGIPYKNTIFGKPKSYVCTSCAKDVGLI